MKYLFLILLLVGCAKRPMATGRTDNSEFDVGKLFTHDGCTLYRFYDNGRHHYFTNCSGRTMTTYSCGKNCTNQEEI